VFGCRFQAGNSSSGPDDDDGFARAPARASAAFERFPARVERKCVGDFNVQPASAEAAEERAGVVDQSLQRCQPGQRQRSRAGM